MWVWLKWSVMWVWLKVVSYVGVVIPCSKAIV